MANATININANGLGTVFNKQTHDGWCEWYFRPNDNAKIAYEWSYVCDITYKPEYERDPDHYTGTARWSRDYIDGDPVLYDQYSWGTASYFDTVNVTIDILGTANSNLLPHSVEPNGSGRYDYFWGWDRSSELSDGTDWYWKVHAEGDYELSDITKYYYADGGGTGESRSTYSIHTLSARGTTTQQLQKDWQYNKIFRQTAHFGIPHLSVTLDPNDSNYTPVQHLSPSCVYLRCKEGDAYGELPTPVRPGY